MVFFFFKRINLLHFIQNVSMNTIGNMLKNKVGNMKPKCPSYRMGNMVDLPPY